MLLAGLGAATGIAPLAYLLLTAYLGMLLCWTSLSSWFAEGEGERS